MTSAVTVRVPATSANLGPGFDCAGLALGLYDEVTVEPTGTAVSVEVSGEGDGEVPLDDRHLVLRALREAGRRLGEVSPGPGLRLTARNAIPQGRGLGSSAGAVVAGVLIAAALRPGRAVGPEELLDVAAAIEGHPDNVAPCLLGGLTLARTEADGHVRAVGFEVDPDLRPIVLVPLDRLATATARGLLPTSVPHADAAANAARAALLVPALTGRPDLLFAATADRLHQDYREASMPRTLAVVRALRAEGWAAAVSGAGPAVLVLGATAPEVAAHCPPDWRVMPLPVDRAGATVVRG